MSSNITSKTIALLCWLLSGIFSSSMLIAQPAPATPAAPLRVELPVVMRQSVVAGKTPVGTKVEAKLALATLVNGVVLPQGALLSGEVTESVAKSKEDPSRLSVRMDSAQWKNGTTPLKVYVTAWYYPVEMMSNQYLSYQPLDAARGGKKDWNGMGTYPDPNNPISQTKFPGRDSDKDPGQTASPTPASNISKHRVVMKNVESARNGDGSFGLTSTHSNIKLDKVTTYVFAADDLLPKI
jgi:hypothetical protein